MVIYNALIDSIMEMMISCFFIINGFILWCSCAKYLSSQKSSDMESLIRLRNMGLLFIILSCLGSLCIGIANLNYATRANPHQINDFAFTVWAFSLIVTQLGITTHPFFLIKRLQYTFGGTMYRISDKTKRILGTITTLILIVFLFNKLLTASDRLNYIPFNLTLKAIHILKYIEFVSWIILGLLQFYMSNLFSSKLLSITIQIGVAETGLNNKQNQLLTLIAKQTVLSRIESIALICLIVTHVVGIFTVYSLPLMFMIIDWVRYGYLLCLSITMQLSFVFGDKYYHCCCFKCHKCYVKRYENKAMKTYQKKSQSINISNESDDNNHYVLLTETTVKL